MIRPKDRKPIAIAVIWEEWAGDAGSEPTFVMVTDAAERLIARITDRMPAILRQKDWATWLGEDDASLADVKALLRTFDDEGAWEMSGADVIEGAEACEDEIAGRSLLIISTRMIMRC